MNKKLHKLYLTDYNLLTAISEASSLRNLVDNLSEGIQKECVKSLK